MRAKGDHQPLKPKHRAGAKARARAASAASAAKDLMPKPAAEEQSATPRRASSGSQGKVRGGKKTRKKGGDESSDAEALDAVELDRMGMDDWAAKGENIYYGGEDDPSDSDERLEQWEMEEDEVKRMEAIRREDLQDDADPKLAEVEEHAFKDFPSDIESSTEADHLHAAKSAANAPGERTRSSANNSTGSAYLDYVFQGNASLEGTAPGLALLVGEIETAMQTLRSSVEPLLLRCRVFSARREGLLPAEMLLVEKYRALLRFVIGLQDEVLRGMRSRADGGKARPALGSGRTWLRSRNPARREQMLVARLHRQLDGNWLRLLEIAKFERVMFEDVRELLAKAATLPPPPVPKARTPRAALSGDEHSEFGRYDEDEDEEDEEEEEEEAIVAHRGGTGARGRQTLLQTDEAEKRVEEAMAAEEERELDHKMKLLHMVEDDALALRYGHKWWYQKFAAAARLESDAANGKRLNEEQLNKVQRKPYLHAMWRRAYRLTFPEIRGDPRRPAGGDTVIMEGGRRPAPLEILLNVRGTRRKHRSRKDSNPRLRLRHRYHDLVVRSRGSVRKVRSGDTSGYSGEASGINPRAKHGTHMSWSKMQKAARQAEHAGKQSKGTAARGRG